MCIEPLQEGGQYWEKATQWEHWVVCDSSWKLLCKLRSRRGGNQNADSDCRESWDAGEKNKKREIGAR